MLFEKGANIQINQSRCLNKYHNGVECNHCVSQCPGKALTVCEMNIYQDKESCFGCGLCLGTCPTEVFTSQQWDETATLEMVSEKDAEVVHVFCAKHRTPYIRQTETHQIAIRIPACLCSTTEGTWYELARITKVELWLDDCRDCPMQMTVQRTEIAVETAREWLLASGHSPQFTYHYERQESIKQASIKMSIKRMKKLKAVETGAKITSRRQLFLSVLGRLGRGDQSNRHPMKRPDVKRRQNLLPAWRRRFEQSYLAHYRQGGEAAYWPSIEIDEQCVNCGMCKANCPTQAIRIEVENGMCRHLFTSGHCIDCRICMLFCTTENIRRDRTINAAPFETQIVHEKPAAVCKRCGSASFKNSENLCHWCREEPPVFDILADVRKNILKESRL